MKGFCACVVFIVFAAWCSSSTASDQIGSGTAADPAWYFGPPKFMGNGAFHTYVVIDHENDMAVAIGCEFSKSFMFDTPFETMQGGNGPMVMSHVDLELPDIAYAYTPFQSYESNWMPLGHPGTPYAYPHIDFHFYVVPKTKRAQWPGGNCGEGVAAETFCKGVTPIPAPCCPPTYINVGIVTPWMGSHLISFMDPALGGMKFENTFIFGTMEGRIVFLEPMITLEYFMMVANGTVASPVCFPIPNPSHYAQEGSYPTEYCISMTDNNFRVEMNKFQKFPGGCGTVEENGAASCAYDGTTAQVSMNALKNCNNCPHYKYTKEQVV